MNHSEAIEQMATERYLLDELEPELREAFEEHLFDCPECTLDLRATVAFVEEAKTLLPELTMEAAAPVPARPVSAKGGWFNFWRPVIAGPIFAALLIVVGYQNLVVYPALRSEVSEPRSVQLVALHDATRTGERKSIEVSRKGDLALAIDLPQDAIYPSYAFELYDAQGKAAWSKGGLEMPLTRQGDGTLSLAIPGSGLRQGTSSLVVYGLGANGHRVEVERYEFDIQLKD